MADKQIREWRGIDNVVIADVLKDTEEEFLTGEVMPLAGVATLSKTTEFSQEEHYYDNMATNIIKAVGADTVTIGVSAIPIAVRAKINGFFYDEETGMMVEDDGDVGYFALGYRTQKDNGDEVLVWRLKGTFSIPDSTHNTRNNGTEANGDEVQWMGVQTIHKFVKTGKGAKAINVDVALGLVDPTGFFDSVQTPDTIKAKTI